MRLDYGIQRACIFSVGLASYQTLFGLLDLGAPPLSLAHLTDAIRDFVDARHRDKQQAFSVFWGTSIFFYWLGTQLIKAGMVPGAPYVPRFPGELPIFCLFGVTQKHAIRQISNNS